MQFESAYCSGAVLQDSGYDKQTVVRGKVNEHVRDGIIYYIAAAPPDYRATFTGSALPFYNQLQAFDNTPNKGRVNVSNLGGDFEIHLMMPNSYYTGLGTVYVPPTLYIEYFNEHGAKRNLSIKLSDGVPFRSLTWPGPGQNTAPRSGPMFYATQFDLPVRSQEQVLRDSAYPANNKMPTDFWGLKPPL